MTPLYEILSKYPELSKTINELASDWVWLFDTPENRKMIEDTTNKVVEEYIVRNRNEKIDDIFEI